MVRFLIRLGIYFVSALIGLFVADILLPGLSINGGWSYLTVAIAFAVIQAILSPLIGQMVSRGAPMFEGGVGIISAAIALFITNLLANGLSVDGITTWIAAAVLIWLFGAIAAFILPFIIGKRAVEQHRSNA